MTACLVLAIALPLTWFVFIYSDSDPYNLGIASSARGSVRVASSDGKALGEFAISACSKSSSHVVLFSGERSVLQMGIGDGVPYPSFEKTSFLFKDAEGALGDTLTDCRVEAFYINSSQTRMPGRRGGGISLPFNLSGDFSIACKGLRTGNGYQFSAQFKNCR